MNRRSFLTFGGANSRKPPTRKSRTQRQAQRVVTLNAQQQASRFLAQATLGGTRTQIDEVASIGFGAWIDQQFATPQSQILQYMRDAIEPVYQLEDQPLLGPPPFRWAWWQAVMMGQDQLRQRVAMALSEIMVISTKTDFLEDLSIGVAHYYDMLLKHAFGNFRDLLFDVTMHPTMGHYLSHAGNRKSDPATNRFPDENYAREVMQLFTIGLFELNLDGSRKLDSNGDPIPTYTNRDITEFAKIFTGMTYGVIPAWLVEEGIDPTSEEAFIYAEPTWENVMVPLKMWEVFHEPGQKRLLNGYVVPSGQTGMQDVNAAVDHLFNHANVGPFIGRLLIQRLVKSHPSSQYIARVASAFNDNGSGVRGDMQAVIKTILLDDEARNLAFLNDPTHGMLREPFVRYTHLCRAFGAHNENGENLFYNYGEYAEGELGQYPFASPSVFNFFSPDFRPIGALEDNGIVAPEFQIMTSVSTIKWINFFNEIIFENVAMEVPKGSEEPEVERLPVVSDVRLDFAPYAAFEGDIGRLLDELDLLLTYGSLSAETRNILTTTLNTLWSNDDDWTEVVKLATVLMLVSPDYGVFR
ncbi:MAG: DUF1800 domain-containing protein [Candidatus Promineifilaceae bacterium]